MTNVLKILREAAKFCHKQKPTLDAIQKGVALTKVEFKKYTRGHDGYWTLTFADETFGELEIVSTEPSKIAEEIQAYMRLVRSIGIPPNMAR